LASMSHNSDLQLCQLTFPKTEDWHRFAASNAIDRDFYLGPANARGEQPCSCIVLSHNDNTYAVAVLFTHSHECGLWVAPSQRRHGLGRLALSRLLAIHCAPLYATVSQTNPHSGAMQHLLAASGFQRMATVQALTIWYWRPERPKQNRAASKEGPGKAG
jgi:RimJ/RimL family protein N-acetyltransferase